MLTFFYQSFFDWKLTRGHIIRYVSLKKKNIIIINPKCNIFTEARTQDSFRVCDLSSYNLLAERVLFFAQFLCRA
jgi:hypothetical protein